MAEQNRNIWAPWRMEYIHTLEEETDDGCFLCRYAQNPDQDGANHVIWRDRLCLTVFNSFPYTGGHLMVAPLEHLAELDELDDAAMGELYRQVRDAMRLLRGTISPHGFNVGMNFGRCAGAGLPGHLHVHIVPRWDGDTNFMPVLGDVHVIPQTIEEIYGLMRESAGKLGLPPLRG
ncbi:MAG: HIT domain-containing protein [Planctomycetota bacterium]|nr:MAG: HIT domain-containing protein [Planctomycetota bacterium]